MADGKRFITLHELNSRVRNTLEEAFLRPLWIQAEISEIRERNGHCYLEFVEKNPDGNDIIAKSSGVIWKSVWVLLRPYFEQVALQPLSSGMQVLVEVEVTFHELYGYKLNVLEIDPTYTVGDIARKRQQILDVLEKEGVKGMNKELPLPSVMRRIAVVSSPSAAGWDDFRDQLTNNQYGLAFDIQLFPAVMQGENLASSIIKALNEIADDMENWDAIVIIRGGGAVSDLAGFDSLELAEHVAQFPLPIITGIGHERDDTVIDMIAHTRVKTPTAAAEFIIFHQLEQLRFVTELIERLNNGVKTLIVGYQRQLENYQLKAGLMTKQYLSTKSHQLEILSNKLILSRLVIQTQSHRLELLRTKLDTADPNRLLNLGFAIVRHDGKAVKDVSSLAEGSLLSITFSNGAAQAVISEIKE